MEKQNEKQKEASRAASLLGSRGGTKTKEKHGKEQFSAMGKKSAEVRRMGKDLVERYQKNKNEKGDD
jgi:hypothetical protein